jgi:hypothetical protein
MNICPGLALRDHFPFFPLLTAGNPVYYGWRQTCFNPVLMLQPVEVLADVRLTNCRMTADFFLS